MITIDYLTKKYGATPSSTTSPSRPGGPGHRLPGSERGRQVHLDADDGRPHHPHVGNRHHLRSQVRRPAQPGTRGRRDARRLRPARRPHRPRDPHHRPAVDGPPRRRVAEMLELVSLTETEANRRVGNYSLGMRQRLGIATALIGDPAVLILDEPANGLDPAGIRWMRDLLRGYADRGGTVLLSSHLLHEIEVIADDIVMIGNGRIVCQGSKTELLHAAGTVVRAADLRPPAGARRVGSGHHRLRRRRPAHRRGPGRVGAWRSRPASPSPSCAPPTAASRRCSSSSPPTPNEKGKQHDRHRHRPRPRAARRRPPGAPLAGHPGRAAQDVRHPFRLLADGEHRHHRRPGHGRDDRVRPGRATSPTTPSPRRSASR